MKKIVILFLLTSLTSLAQSKELNKIFFNIPLNSSRDSIFSFCENSGFITKVKNKSKVTKQGVEIKIFNGFHNRVETVDTRLDSIQFQLSTGSQSTQGEKGYKNLLVFFLDYVIVDKKDSELKYEELKKQINDILKLKSYGGITRNEKRKKIGKYDDWFLGNGLVFSLHYEIINRKKYNIRIEYNRFE